MKVFSRKPDFTISKKGISQIENITVGEISQTILIQTEDIQNPIIFFLHGGPSIPVPGVSNRGKDYALVTCTKHLIKYFTLVFWDQRGTGKSYSRNIAKETMHLNQFINDANEIIDYLRVRFHQNKLHLMAHSWGSMIGLSLVKRYPEKFYSYTGFSQITNWAENDKLCYQWLLGKAKETKNRKAMNELADIGEPPYQSLKHWGIIRKWLLRYKSMIYDTGDHRAPTYFKTASTLIKSPDYSALDVFNSLILGFKLAYTDQMIYDFNRVNFFTEIPKVAVPVFFIHGEKDKQIMPELIQSYFDQLEAPHKQLFWAKKSSHIFHQEDAEEIEQQIIANLTKLENQ